MYHSSIFYMIGVAVLHADEYSDAALCTRSKKYHATCEVWSWYLHC